MLNKELLLSIFKIASPSSKEKSIANFIKLKLNEFHIPFETDTVGNIYNVSNKDKIILSAHMDTVQSDDDAKLAHLIKMRGNIISGYGVIGGDDKCGIYMILHFLQKDKTLNFIFSVEEEIGGRGIIHFCKEKSKELKENVNFGLILDRNGKGDIICKDNTYGTKIFEDKLKEIGTEFGFKPTRGSFSDANSLRDFFSCANLSVGYFNPHRKDEFVDINYLINSIRYVDKIIEKIGDTKFEPEKVVAYSYTKNSSHNKTNNYSHGNYIGYGYGYDYDYDDYDDTFNYPKISSVNKAKNKCGICGKEKESCKYLPSTKIYVCTDCLLTLIGDLEDQDLTINTVIDEVFSWEY